jgi:putative two-component system response regulator
VVDLIKDNNGRHFDPALVEVFLQELPGIVAIRERFAEPVAPG